MLGLVTVDLLFYREDSALSLHPSLSFSLLGFKNLIDEQRRQEMFSEFCLRAPEKNI